PHHHVAHPLTELSVVHLRPRNPDNGERVRQEPLHVELEQRRQQFASRQVATRSEDHYRTRIRGAGATEPGRFHVEGDPLPADGFRTAHGRTSVTACPPNCLRSAAITWWAKRRSVRESKRSKSATLIPGTGIPRSSA